MAFSVEITEDPRYFLEVAEDLLTREPMIGTVIAGVTNRAAAMPGPHPLTEDLTAWWAVVRDADGAVVSAAMRTAQFTPHPMFVMPMPPEAVEALAAAIGERDEHVGAANGALPATGQLLEALAARYGGAPVVRERTRLHGLADLVMPPSPPGRLRLATMAEADLCLTWFQAFFIDAAAQAGRAGEHPGADGIDAEVIADRIDRGVIFLWEDEAGQVVHLTGGSEAAFGVSRIGPVYTPSEHRGRGYASRAVAEVSAIRRAEGAEVCLFTDLDNPTSNKIYAAIGFEPVLDMANLEVE
jgi:GNAT superfamily N-acetyltransferase